MRHADIYAHAPMRTNTNRWHTEISLTVFGELKTCTSIKILILLFSLSEFLHINTMYIRK